MNASFRVVETDFLASTNHKLFFRLVETYFLTNPSFQLLEKDFLFSENRPVETIIQIKVRLFLIQ